jgi:hypothetical protein
LTDTSGAACAVAGSPTTVTARQAKIDICGLVIAFSLLVPTLRNKRGSPK